MVALVQGEPLCRHDLARQPVNLLLCRAVALDGRRRLVQGKQKLIVCVREGGNKRSARQPTARTLLLLVNLSCAENDKLRIQEIHYRAEATTRRYAVSRERKNKQDPPPREPQLPRKGPPYALTTPHTVLGEVPVHHGQAKIHRVNVGPPQPSQPPQLCVLSRDASQEAACRRDK